jgi:predicted porin
LLTAKAGKTPLAIPSPNLSGLTLSAQHSAKENGKAVGAGQVNGGATAVAANYTVGALGLSAVYGDVRSVDATVAAEQNQAWLLGASYDFGVVKAFAQYGQNKAEDAAGADVSKDKFYQVGAVVPVTQAGAVHAAYGQVKTNFPVGADEKERQFSLAYHHTLSKRTGVYAGLTYSKDDNGAAADTKTTIIAVGLRHAF